MMLFFKHFFAVLLFCAFSANGFAQVYRYKAVSFSIMEKNAKNQWSNWKAFEPSTSVITLDGSKDRIVIGSQDIQLFKILNYGKKVSNKNTDTIVLNCLDNDNGNVSIVIVTHKNEDDRMQFYIIYDDVKYVYNVYKV